MRLQLPSISIVMLLLHLATGCSSEDTDIEPPTNSSDTLNILQTSNYGGSENDVAHAVVRTQDGGIVVLGTTKSIDGDIIDHEAVNDDIWLFKVSESGTIVWSRTYGGSDEDQGQDILQTDDGGFLIVGYTRSSDGNVSINAGFYDQWVLKVDANGILQWEKSFGFAGTDQAFSVVETEEGGFFVAGFLDVSASQGEGNSGKGPSTAHGVGEFWGHKLDANGYVIWSRFFGGTGNDRSYDVLRTDDNAFLLVGASESADFDITDSRGSYDFWVVKVNENGNLEWQKSLGGSGIDIAYGVVKAMNGYIIAGDSRSTDGDISSNNGEADFWVIKIDLEGNLVWENSYGGSDFESAQAIVASTDGNYLITGTSKSADGDVSNNGGNNDFWIIKIGEEGQLIWEQSFGGTALDFARDIVETSPGNYTVVGETESTSTSIANKGKKDVLVLNAQEP